jgi:hypothetical protein
VGKVVFLRWEQCFWGVFVRDQKRRLYARQMLAAADGDKGAFYRKMMVKWCFLSDLGWKNGLLGVVLGGKSGVFAVGTVFWGVFVRDQKRRLYARQMLAAADGDKGAFISSLCAFWAIWGGKTDFLVSF